MADDRRGDGHGRRLVTATKGENEMTTASWLVALVYIITPFAVMLAKRRFPGWLCSAWIVLPLAALILHATDIFR